MNDPIPHGWRWGAVAVLAAIALTRATLAPSVFHIAILGLAGLALLPVVGWLRTLWFAPLPAAGLAAWTTAALLQRGQAVTLAFAAATVVGALVATGLAMLTQRMRPKVRPWVSLLVAFAVSVLVLPRAAGVPVGPPLLFGVDLSSDKALAVTSLILLAAGLWVITNLAAARAGREIATAGASTELAVRSGASTPDAWMRAGIVSGVLAGWIGLLLTLDVQGLPGTPQVGPAIAVVWLAVPLIGGVAWPSGALAGAVLIGGLAAVLQVAEPVIAAVAVAAAALLGDRGLVGEVARRREAR